MLRRTLAIEQYQDCSVELDDVLYATSSTLLLLTPVGSLLTARPRQHSRLLCDTGTVNRLRT